MTVWDLQLFTVFSYRTACDRVATLAQLSRRSLFHWLVAATLVLLLAPVSSAQARPEVAEPFRDYYAQYQGIRVLGFPLTGLVEAGDYAAQYFEKGRIEDHRGEV